MTVEMLFSKGSQIRVRAQLSAQLMPHSDLRAYIGVSTSLLLTWESRSEFYMLNNPLMVNSYATLPIFLPALQQRRLLVKQILPSSYIHPVTPATFAVVLFCEGGVEEWDSHAGHCKNQASVLPGESSSQEHITAKRRAQASSKTFRNLIKQWILCSSYSIKLFNAWTERRFPIISWLPKYHRAMSFPIWTAIYWLWSWQLLVIDL